MPMKKARTAAFEASRLSPTVFLIVEVNDIYSERPYIYAKILPDLTSMMLVDTGCGGASNNPDVQVTSLREFVETIPVSDNGNEPLNAGGQYKYVVVVSHCHYDHILAVEDFASDSTIFASAHNPSFISPENLPESSLCAPMGIRTPSYTPTLIPHLHSILSGAAIALATPGHTPDSLTLWDTAEQMLYVGDTLYEDAAILFSSGGSIIDWYNSVENLKVMMHAYPAARINCGHATAGRPALVVLEGAQQFMRDVVTGKEPVRERLKRRGEDYVRYKQAHGRFALGCPERLVKEAREASWAK